MHDCADSFVGAGDASSLQTVVMDLAHIMDPSKLGFRSLHSTQRQLQSLHWAFETVPEQKQQLY